MVCWSIRFARRVFTPRSSLGSPIVSMIFCLMLSHFLPSYLYCVPQSFSNCYTGQSPSLPTLHSSRRSDTVLTCLLILYRGIFLLSRCKDITAVDVALVRASLFGEPEEESEEEWTEVLEMLFWYLSIAGVCSVLLAGY